MSRGRSSSGGRGSSSSGGSRGSSSRSSRSSSRVHIVHHRSGTSHHSSSGGKPPFLVMAIFFLIFGLSAIYGGIGFIVQGNEYGSVQATAISNDYIGGWYYTTYEYTINDIEYESRSSEGWEYPEEIGSIVTIYYLQSNPYEITELEQEGMDIEAVIMFIGLGAVFVGASVLLFMNAKKAKAQAVEAKKEVETMLTGKVDPDFVKCAYCDSTYSKGLPSCPRCGAGRKQ